LQRSKLAAAYEPLLRGDPSLLSAQPPSHLLGEDWQPTRAWDELLLLKARALAAPGARPRSCAPSRLMHLS